MCGINLTGSGLKKEKGAAIDSHDSHGAAIDSQVRIWLNLTIARFCYDLLAVTEIKSP